MASGLVKHISMGGPGWFDAGSAYGNSVLYSDAYVNNHDYLAQSGALFVTIWVDWWQFQGKDDPNWPVPGDYATSWAQLHNGQEANFQRLDAEINAVLALGKYPVLRCYQRFPYWARQHGSNLGLPDNQTLPANTTANGPWAWWLDYLVCRYKRGVPLNPQGPHPGGANDYYGNPSGAWIFALAPMNEVNLLNGATRNRADQSAEMIQTAAAIQAFYGTPAVLFVPEMSDFPYNASDGSNQPPSGYPYDTYSGGILNDLVNFRPTTTVLWSQHNYYDVKHYSNSNDPHQWPNTRAADVRARLYSKQWKGPSADRYVYLTEGVYDLYAAINSSTSPITYNQAANNQSVLGSNNFGEMVAMPDLVMFTNHEIRDGGTFWSGFYPTSGTPERPWGTVFPAIHG